MFTALLIFSESLATKCVPLNIKTCMIRLTVIDYSSAELNYYPLMISLDKCNGSFNVILLIVLYHAILQHNLFK